MTVSQDYPGEMMPVRAIPLTQGQVTIIDPEDALTVSGHKWHAHKATGGCYYAVSSKREGAIVIKTRMHLLLTGARLADHVNHDTLDNRMVNLRIASVSQNGMNRLLQVNNTSGHAGVSHNKRENKWKAYIKVRKQQIHLGTFNTISEAIDARHTAVCKFFDEFAPACCERLAR